MYDWINSVPDDELDELIEGLLGSEGMITAHKVHRALEDERWRRHAVAVTSWITVPWTSKRPDLNVVLFCLKAKGPDDPKHRPTRALMKPLSASDRISSPSGFHGLVLSEQCDQIECSCGRRVSTVMLAHHRAKGVSIGWPIEIKGKRYTCPNMKSLDDPSMLHAFICAYEGEGYQEYRCLCREFEFEELREVK